MFLLSLCYVPLHAFFRNSADTSVEVSFRPEFFAPEFVLEHIQMTFSHHVAAKSFDELHHFYLADKSYIWNEQMQVVWAKTIAR